MTRERSATRALVLGLLGLLFGIFAPFAVWAGARCLWNIRHSPGNLTGDGSAFVGLVAGLIGLTFMVIGIGYWFLAS